VDGRTIRAAARATARERLLIAGAQGYDAPVSGPTAQLEALAGAVSALGASGIAHALIGGLAVGVVTGVPRATLDVDLAVPSSTDRGRLITAMTAAGFQLVGEHPHSVNFRHRSGEPVQLAMDAPFDPMIERADALVVGDLEIRVVTRADLIAMKRRAAEDPGRRRSKALRDQADLELLLGDVPDPDEGW
jgi:hypothetical protein